MDLAEIVSWLAYTSPSLIADPACRAGSLYNIRLE